MARPNQQNRHRSRINSISDTIRTIVSQKQEITAFPSGSEVEVASHAEGYIGSYFQATILFPIGAYFYRVRYKNLVTDDHSVPLEEYISVEEVRPIPPDHLQIQIRTLKPYDMVDVYANEGWWLGVITEKVGRKYKVHFPTTDETLEYSIDELRFHQEWSNGQWTLPSS